MKVRMLPVANVFSRFRRVVRDLAKRPAARRSVLEVYGEETEIDKKVMDRIGEPLVHLVRNAVDHGIESRRRPPACRQGPQRARPARGLPGRGPHLHRGRRRREGPGPGGDPGQGAGARACSAARTARPLSESGSWSSIFLPGFSTAREVTDISGRGVGMDVVKRTVEEMGGSVAPALRPGPGHHGDHLPAPDHGHHPRAAGGGRAGPSLAIPLSSVREIVKLTARQPAHHRRPERAPAARGGALAGRACREAPRAGRRRGGRERQAPPPAGRTPRR